MERLGLFPLGLVLMPSERIPLHIYGVGSSSFGQLRLRDAGVPESVFLDDLVAAFCTLLVLSLWRVVTA